MSRDDLLRIVKSCGQSRFFKHAVNAALLAAIQCYHDPADNNFHTWHGLAGVAWMMGSAVVAREIIPRLLAWSHTD